MAPFLKMIMGCIPIISVTLKVASTACGKRTRARAQTFTINSMIVLLLAITRGGFTIPIPAIVLITGMASGMRVMMIFSMLVATVTISLCMGVRIGARRFPIIRVTKVMMLVGTPCYVVTIILANMTEIGFLT